MLRARAAAAVSGVVLAISVWALSSGPGARAEVVRGDGFSARVDGYQGWFGSYQMAGLGTTWCIDHGIAAPDAGFGYVPIELSDRPPAVRRAIAWALGRHGPDADRVGAAALMLAIHDLMGARYPSGPLDLERPGAGLSGFEGAERQVLSRALAIKADALAHSGHDGPFSLTATAEPVGPGRPGLLVARLTDAAGAGVAGVTLRAIAEGGSGAAGRTLAPVGAAVTDGGGTQRFSFTAVRGTNRFEVSGLLPDPRLQSFAPTARRAQRVARPGRLPVSASARFEAQPRRLRVRKVGDATAYVPVAGARFTVVAVGAQGSSRTPVGELVTDTAGNTGTLELDAGAYQVDEVAPPPGYAPRGPWRVDLDNVPEVLLQVANAVKPGEARITKVDAVTGRALAGARMTLAYDRDADGTFETPLEPVVSRAEPTIRTGLLPGNYELREVAPPAGYAPADRSVGFTLGPGQTTAVSLANRALPPTPSPATPVGPSPPASPNRSAQPGRLPATGQPVAALSLTGSGMAGAGLLLTALARSSVGPSRRRCRRRAAALGRGQTDRRVRRPLRH